MIKSIEELYQKYGVQNIELLNARGGDILADAGVDADTRGRYAEVLTDLQSCLATMYHNGYKSPVDTEEHLVKHLRW